MCQAQKTGKKSGKKQKTEKTQHCNIFKPNIFLEFSANFSRKSKTATSESDLARQVDLWRPAVAPDCTSIRPRRLPRRGEGRLTSWYRKKVKKRPFSSRKPPIFGTAPFLSGTETNCVQNGTNLRIIFMTFVLFTLLQNAIFFKEEYCSQSF